MSATWRHVARKEFEDAVRSRLLWGLTLAFVVLMGIFTFVAAAEEGEITPLEAFAFLGTWSQFFVPLIAVVAGYMAVVGERRSGRLRVLLSYPFSRAGIVTGKVVGRSIVVTISIVSGFVAVGALTIAAMGSPPIGAAATIVALTVGLGITFTALAVGISAGTHARGTAMALAVGVFFLYFGLWQAVTVGAYYLVAGSRPGLQVDAWYLFLRQLNPIEAYRVALSAVAEQYVGPIVRLGLEDIPMDAPPEDRMVSARVAGDRPFYLSPLLSGIVFLVYSVVPASLGYLRFRRSDVN